MKRTTSTDKLLTLGLALYADRRTMENRVRGIFGRKRTAWLARVLAAALCLVVGVACFTTACVPVRKKAFIKHENELNLVPAVSGYSMANVASAPSTVPEAVSPLYEKLGIPQHWTSSESSADGLIQVEADADVIVPNVARVPTAKATLRKLTEKDLHLAADTIFGENATFYYSEEDTREYMEERLADSEKLVAELDDGTGTNKLPSWEKSVRGQYEYWKRMAETAPSASERRERPLALYERVTAQGDAYMGFIGDAMLGGELFTLGFAEYGLSVRRATPGEGYAFYFGSYRSTPPGLQLTAEEAGKQASAIAAKLDNGLTLTHVSVGGRSAGTGEMKLDRWGWVCTFMRQVNGVPSVYDSRDVNSDISIDVDNGIPNEMIEIVMDDTGLAALRWLRPLAQEAVTNEDTTLLPFGRVTERLVEQMREKYDYDVTRENPTSTWYIWRAELGLMRIGKPGSESYTLEPVWSFFADANESRDYTDETRYPGILDVATDGDPKYWNSLTVSAVDGRVIDRNRGY